MAYQKKEFMSQKERQDKAFDLFADMIIEKLEHVSANWKKPWFTEGVLSWPKALYGKSYHGLNALMLTLLCEKEGYKIPVFATHDYIHSLNYSKNEDGTRSPALSEDGEKLPFLHVLKGEHSFPVFLSTVNIVHKETKEKIKYQDYIKLSQDEQSEYDVHHVRRVHYVFNVDQTNLQEARPELYAKLQQDNCPQKLDFTDNFSFEPLDKMVDENLWICDIKPRHQDQAFYSISKNEIVIPEKEQFVVTGHPESYYGTMLHEMIHSTGAAHQLNRFGEKSGDSNAYGREELVAELGAALCCFRYGIPKIIKEVSVPYLKSWLDSLNQDPQFIRTVLNDVKAATSVVDVRIDSVKEVFLGDDISSVINDSINSEESGQERKELVLPLYSNNDVTIQQEETSSRPQLKMW